MELEIIKMEEKDRKFVDFVEKVLDMPMSQYHIEICKVIETLGAEEVKKRIIKAFSNPRGKLNN